jgi:hypothetical protein
VATRGFSGDAINVASRSTRALDGPIPFLVFEPDDDLFGVFDPMGDAVFAGIARHSAFSQQWCRRQAGKPVAYRSLIGETVVCHRQERYVGVGRLAVKTTPVQMASFKLEDNSFRHTGVCLRHFCLAALEASEDFVAQNSAIRHHVLVAVCAAVAHRVIGGHHHRTADLSIMGLRECEKG